MKKTLIALSVAGFIAGSANAITVYDNNGTTLDVSGSARVMLTKTTRERSDLKNDGSRIKFKFSQQIDQGFSALGAIELRPGVDSTGESINSKNFGSSIVTKYLYAGFKVDDVGTLTFGRQKTAGDAFKLADPAEQDQAINDGLGLMTEAKKVAHFSSADFYGLSAEASYIFDEDASKFTNKKFNTNANSYQLLAKYEEMFGDFGLKFHALYAHNKFHTESGNTLNTETNRSQNTWGLAAAVSYADVSLAVDYAVTKLDANKGGLKVSEFLPSWADSQQYEVNKAKGVQVALAYQIIEPLDIYTLYHTYTYTGENNFRTSLSGFGVGTHYYLSQNVMAYLEYNRDKLSGNLKADNAVYLGLRVFF